MLYTIVTGIRNILYDWGILKSKQFDLPVICVGNLAVGGTGKTPHTEYIISILKDKWNLAMLSRGYKRQTKDFILAGGDDNAQTIGDEPFQMYQKFQDIHVAVDKNRVRGIEKLRKQFSDLQLVILDDAFQHRKVDAGLKILLTDHSNPYTQDYVLPVGWLRESRLGAKRADIIVVTKCPENISRLELRILEKTFNLSPSQKLYFSTIIYQNLQPVFSSGNSIDIASLQNTDVLVVSGIVNPQSMVKYIESRAKITIPLSFPDHHQFSVSDYKTITSKFNTIGNNDKLIILTEKDASRVLHDLNFPEELKPITYMLPIKIKILRDEEPNFIQNIRNYVTENSRNRSLSSN